MAKAFDINIKDITRFETTLEQFSTRAIPAATRETVNEAAAVTMRISKNRIHKQFTIRNKWTEGSIRTQPTKAREITRQAAYVGSMQDYMSDQEFGSVKKRKGKEGVPIPTGFASGEGDAPRPRKKLPKGKKNIRRIKLQRSRSRKAKSRKQALLFKVQDAVSTGQRDIFHDFQGGKKKGIFRVVGGRKGFKRGWPKGARLKMLYDLSMSAVIIPKGPWLHPSVKLVEPHLGEIYLKALKKQSRKLNP